MKNKEKESTWIKVYILLLFLCGIGLWVSMQPVHKQTISKDISIDKKVVDILLANGVIQEDILNQYIRERNTRTAQWNEFYKTIKLKGSKTAQSFETGFRSIARSMKVGLSKEENLDGSITYKFFSPDRTYANITLINPKKYQKR